MSNKNLPQNSENKNEFIKEFFELQQQEIATKRDELAIKKDELALRREEAQLNKEMAMKSFDAQKEVELQRGDVFLQNQLSKYRLFGIFGLLFTIIVGLAMFLDKTDIAVRIVEITGSVLLGYFAGINKGKVQLLEKQNRQQNKEDDE